MPTVVALPRLTDTMREGTLAGWLKAVGDRVEPGDALAEVETDKAVMTFESFDEGVLLAILVQPGEAVPLDTPICVLGDAGEDVSELTAELQLQVSQAIAALAGAEPTPDTIAAAPPEPEPEQEQEQQQQAAPPAPAPVTPRAPAPRPPTDDDGRRIRVSPLARRLAAERGIDLRAVAGSGPHGRILRRDVVGLEPPRRILARPTAAPSPAVRDDELVRVTQMRKTIARRLVEAKQTAPHYYLTITVDCDRLVALRSEFNELQDRQRISYNDLVMRACVVALLDHPEVNAAWEGAAMRRFGAVHLGFAVALDDGLITPVVRNAESLGLPELAAEVRDLAGRARAGTLQPEEYTGNSFCVSNLGMLGVDHFTAIINPPAACILAVGALRDEVVLRDGVVGTRKVMTMTLSCDHRVVDGATGASFLADLRAAIERPLNLLF